MFKRSLVAVAMVALVFAAVPAGAITNGVPDEGEHPMVGMLIFFIPDVPDPRFEDPGSWFLCSGTLLSEKVLLTAGHCTFGIGQEGDSTMPDGVGGNDVWVTFEEDARLGQWLPPSTEYATNQERYDDWSGILDASEDWHRGTAQSHPNYDDRAFFLFDVGAVVLDVRAPGDIPLVVDLPDVGYLDQFLTRRGQRSQLFTAVGYGLESGFPTFHGGQTRNKATSRLIDGTGVFGIGPGIAVVLSNNKGQPHTGGTCFGDSGGPVFEEGTTRIVAVTSFGISLNCVGTSGAYRIDKHEDLEWIGGVLAAAAEETVGSKSRGKRGPRR
jgi:hypothetical protein